jgi:hypothetical protein
MNKFKYTRIPNKAYWLRESKRKRYINDNINNSLECEWQTTFSNNNEHISIFCSLGEWSANLTDLLFDGRIDTLDFDNEAHRNALFRYYTRILLVASEILTDFQDIVLYLKRFSGNNDNKKRDKARRFLSDPNLSFNFQQLFNYINQVCKHKFGDAQITSRYHICNHHIDYEFVDSKNYRSNVHNRKITNLNHGNGTKIEIPALKDIIDQILYCYVQLDKVLKDNSIDVESKLQSFVRQI